MRVSLACRLLGHCRQAFYQWKAGIEKEVEHERKLLSAVKDIRAEDPGIGGYKLWLILISMFGRDYVPGGDRFFVIMRRKGLMLPRPKPRHTTNSNHRYHKWKNLVKNFTPTSSNRLWVADITYIALANGGLCYLHLITDAYSHMIVGWVLADSLQASFSVQALRMALEQALGMRDSRDLTGLIHYSDRGVQYCCDAYVSLLRAHGIAISMTEDHKPTDNAIAERANGIIKTECVYPRKQLLTLEQARDVIARFIDFYNHSRPHMSIGYKTPAEAHRLQSSQQRMWKSKIYGKHERENKEESVSWQRQTESSGDNLCR